MQGNIDKLDKILEKKIDSKSWQQWGEDLETIYGSGTNNFSPWESSRDISIKLKGKG